MNRARTPGPPYRARFGLVLLSLTSLATIAAVIGFQWNATHVFNTEWHPHARFHAVQLTAFVIVLSIVGIWLLWRRSAEPHIGTAVATAVQLTFWSGELLALSIPGTSAAFDLDHPNTFEAFGIDIYGNLFFACLMIACSLLGYLFAARGRRDRPVIRE